MAASDPKKSLNSFVRLLLYKYGVTTRAQLDEPSRRLSARRILDELKLYAPGAADALEAAWADHVHGSKLVPVEQVGEDELLAFMEWDEPTHSVYRQVPADEAPDRPSHSVENPQAPVGFGQQMKVPESTQPGDAWGSGPDAQGPVHGSSSGSASDGAGSGSGSARVLESELDGLHAPYGHGLTGQGGEHVAAQASGVLGVARAAAMPNWGVRERRDTQAGLPGSRAAA